MTSVEPSFRDAASSLNTAAPAGLAGAGLSSGLSSCKQEARTAAAAPARRPGTPAAHAADELNIHPAPGQARHLLRRVVRRPLGRSARPRSAPSGREIKRVPTFNIDCMSGWGITNESKAIITAPRPMAA